MGKTITEREFEKRTRPSVRLFLSVDLIGSTKLKQASKLTQKSPNQWLDEILFFLTDFSTTLSARIQEALRSEGKRNLKPPKLWKALGDELVFEAEISRAHELVTYVGAFHKALNAWNSQVDNAEFTANLPLKGAAWVAGFPVGNTVLDVPNGTRDYAGPSIDAGFRIASQATKRRLMLSVELAWFLLKKNSPFKINYSGPILLKGLSDDIGYPGLWIEVGDSKYLKHDRRITGQDHENTNDNMLQLCEQYVSEFGVPNHLPFLEQDSDISQPPSDYERLRELKIEELRKIYLPDGTEGTGKVDKSKARLMVETIDDVKKPGAESPV